jgi:hypothetical protein
VTAGLYVLCCLVIATLGCMSPRLRYTRSLPELLKAEKFGQHVA